MDDLCHRVNHTYKGAGEGDDGNAGADGEVPLIRPPTNATDTFSPGGEKEKRERPVLSD